MKCALAANAREGAAIIENARDVVVVVILIGS
jgi:hypothetical protein